MSAICQQIKGEYQAWARRRLDEVTLNYLFLDASFFRMHPGSPAEPVLAAWGITTGGKPAFIGLAPGSLALVWAVLDRAARGWRGFTMTADGLRLLQDLRRSLLDPPRQLRPRAVTQIPADDVPETVRATA